MLLTITTTHQPATDLGYLLHKHPARAQSFKLNFGQAHVFYPEASEERCTAVLLLDMNPINLVRGSAGGFALQSYVNDRPYVASSFLSVMGYEAAAVVEVIEHLDPARLAAFARLLFGEYRPSLVVITTPNREYNAMWPGLPAGQFCHRDHRFEWTRAEFAAWGQAVAEQYGYTVDFSPIGAEVEDLGAPSQIGVFVRGILNG